MDEELPVRPAVSVAVIADGKILLVERLRAPAQGMFAFPGGRAEPNETLEAAARRELFEETGLRADELREFSACRTLGIDCIYALTLFTAHGVSGTAAPGSDARSAQFYSQQEISGLPLAPNMREAIRALLGGGH
jgi:8-oxo-dGTP diphosphatase